MKSRDWIRIEDKTPRCYRWVLVCLTIEEEQYISIAALYVSDSRGYLEWHDEDGNELEGVTHWMPIVLPRK